jgi:hypothetical protein
VRAAAFVHGPKRVHDLGNAFVIGCKKLGIECSLIDFEKSAKRPDADVVWLYGLGPARPVFDFYAGKATRLVGDKGYFAEYATGPKFFRYSIDSQQPTQAMVRDRPLDRWEALGIIKVDPTIGSGTLICGMGPKQCERLGLKYGDWERSKHKELGGVVREKPKNPPISGVPRCNAKTATEAIRGSSLVVCKTGNMGADAILHGVPVMADAGPGALEWKSREHALSNIAYWQWTVEEIANGLLMRDLEDHHLLR